VEKDQLAVIDLEGAHRRQGILAGQCPHRLHDHLLAILARPVPRELIESAKRGRHLPLCDCFRRFAIVGQPPAEPEFHEAAEGRNSGVGAFGRH